MAKIDIDNYRTFTNMGKTCEKRVICEKKVIWPEIDKKLFGNSIRIRSICLGDVDEAAELWRMSYPEVYGSPHEWILHPEEYNEHVALKETWKEDSVNKRFCMYVAEVIETGKLVGGSLLTKEDKNLHVEYTLATIHPDYRKGKKGTKIWLVALEIFKFLEESGAEYMTTFCETWHNITQYMCLKQVGWKIAGIFPGNYTRWSGGQEEYRGCEVHFYKFLGDGAKYATKLEEWKLIPEAKKLWDVLEEINKESDDVALREHRDKSN